MRLSKLLLQLCCGLLLLGSMPLVAQDKYVLVTNPSKVQDVCGRHGLTPITQTTSQQANQANKHGVFLVSTFSVDPSIATDSDVQSFEPNHTLVVPELSGATIANLTQSTTSILDGLPGRTVVTYFGSQVASNYVSQPATTLIRHNEAQSDTGLI